jgi:hypothetical protein
MIGNFLSLKNIFHPDCFYRSQDHHSIETLTQNLGVWFEQNCLNLANASFRITKE